MIEERQPLSEREREILQLVVTGATNLQIARRLMISPNTVKVHLRNIYEKMGVQSRTEASMVAVREGWVALAGVEAAPAAPPVRRQWPAIALWQRVYLLAALAVVLLAFFYPQFSRGRTASSPASDLSDPPLLADLTGLGVGDEQWTAQAMMPAARSRLALVPYEGKLYAIAGATATGVSGIVEVYDPESNGWLPRAAKPTPVSNVGGVVLEGLIYVPGGYTAEGEVTDVLEVYDPQGDTWHTRAALPQPLCAYAIASAEGRMYLFGGWDGEQYVSAVYIYDPTTDGWASGTPLSSARGFAAAGELEGLIFVAGGYDGRRELALLEVYDPGQEARGKRPWATRAAMAAPRGGLGMAVTGSALYVIGGGWEQAVDFNERYDPHTDTWSSIPTPLPDQWRHLGVAALGERIFAIGGWSGGHLAVNQEYRTLLYRIHLPLGSKGSGQ
ncbi:MAG: LuxR C-terminal-related transcriptional regulator [Anaerolineae bacterium]|nr:LuxR C-terminal-related transcriptional regulator [Anaerolineae bacterium]